MRGLFLRRQYEFILASQNVAKETENRYTISEDAQELKFGAKNTT